MKLERWYRNGRVFGEPRENVCFDEELALDLRSLRKPKHEFAVHVEGRAVVAFAEVRDLGRAKVRELFSYYLRD
jgi:hypothetical protein